MFSITIMVPTLETTRFFNDNEIDRRDMIKVRLYQTTQNGPQQLLNETHCVVIWGNNHYNNAFFRANRLVGSAW